MKKTKGYRFLNESTVAIPAKFSVSIPYGTCPLSYRITGWSTGA